MRITYVRLTLALAVVAATLVTVGAPSAGLVTSARAAKCEEGPVNINGRLWVLYCGPAKATVRFSGRTVRFVSGRCITRNGVKFLYLGRRPFRGLAPSTKYWELTTKTGRDGVVRNNVFVEWWLGRKHYVIDQDTIKMTFKNKRNKGTYTGKLISGAKGKASGSYSC
jgi:hypothetical protein